MHQLPSNHTNSITKKQTVQMTGKEANTLSSWNISQIEEFLDLPFNDLIYQAQFVHRQYHDANFVQLSTLVSVKTGGCSEDCGYCPQAARYNTGVNDEDMLSLDKVVSTAKEAKSQGASRFCMGAAWRGPKQRDIEKITEIISAVKELGLETCATLGMLKTGQAEQLSKAGLDYYNHNLDTAPEFYGEVITTRDYQDRLNTLESVRSAGMHVCCGGIVGMGLVQVKGTPLYGTDELDSFEFIRTIAAARITMPKAMVRLSAGRSEMSEAVQALCFLAGANSIFYGDKTGNPEVEQDKIMFRKLGLQSL
jgi:biotin synthase